MKACIIGARNINGMTLMSIYTDIFEKYGIQYDLIYLDRLGIEEKCEADKVYPFRFETKNTGNRIIDFIRYQTQLYSFKRYAINIIEENKYDFIVLWIEEMAYLFADYMAKQYRNKYSVNIRDVWGRKHNFIINKIQAAVSNSAINTVSSPEFIKELPPADYLFVHSANLKLVRGINANNPTVLDNPIVISSVGTFRNDEYCFNIVDCFANDSRFFLKFIGNGSERMEEYCKKNNYNNVFCAGSFNPIETASKLKGSSVVNCAYGADNSAETTKIPIRIYYALYSGVPILCTEGTEIARFSHELNADIVIPKELKKGKSIADSVFRAYRSIDLVAMQEKMNAKKSEIEESHVILEKKVCQAFGIAPQ